MDCSPPGCSVHGILQARILEWGAISFSRGSSWPGDGTQVSCITGRFFTHWATQEAQEAREAHVSPNMGKHQTISDPHLRHWSFMLHHPTSSRCYHLQMCTQISCSEKFRDRGTHKTLTPDVHWMLGGALHSCPKLQAEPKALYLWVVQWGFHNGSVAKNRLQCSRCRFTPCVGKIPWRRKW